VLGLLVTRSWVRFDPEGQGEELVLQGALMQTSGALAPDYRQGEEVHGSLSIRFGVTNPVIVHDGLELTFEVSDEDGTDNRETWRYRGPAQEEVVLQWKGAQHYDANRDPGFPEDLGRLFTRYIHTDESRFRLDYTDARLPVTVAIDGIPLVTVDEGGGVSSTLPHWMSSNRVDVLYPAKLGPGRTVAWYADGKPGDGLTHLVYEHEPSSEGAVADTFVNAGGIFWMRMPVDQVPVSFEDRRVVITLRLGVEGQTETCLGRCVAGPYEPWHNIWLLRDP
jgi:hypothetical protein